MQSTGSSSTSSDSGSGSSPAGSIISSPVQTLLVKCECDQRLKRIRYQLPLSYETFQDSIARALQFDGYTAFSITYEDDDGEHCDITTDEDLDEAVHYFSPSDSGSTDGEDGSGSSRSQGCIAMRVSVRVESAISLSDFNSEIDGDDSSVFSVGSDFKDRFSRREWAEGGRGHLSGRGSHVSSHRGRDNPFSASSVASSNSYGGGRSWPIQPRVPTVDSNLNIDFDSSVDLESLHLSVDDLEEQRRPRSRRSSGSDSDPRADERSSSSSSTRSSRSSRRSGGHRRGREQRDRVQHRRDSDARDADTRSERSWYKSWEARKLHLQSAKHDVIAAGTLARGAFLNARTSIGQIGSDLGWALGQSRPTKAPSNNEVASVSSRGSSGGRCLVGNARRAIFSQGQGSISQPELVSKSAQDAAKVEATQQLSLEALQANARLHAERDARTKSRSEVESDEGVSLWPSASPSETEAQNGHLDDLDGLSQLGARSDVVPPSSLNLGRAQSEDFSDSSSDSDDSLATVSHGSPPNVNSPRFGSSSPSGTVMVLRPADEATMRSLQQLPWGPSSTSSSELGSTKTLTPAEASRDCECKCSGCGAAFDFDALRYVCDGCGPRRISVGRARSASDSSGGSTRTHHPSEDMPVSPGTTDVPHLPGTFVEGTSEPVSPADPNADLAEAWSDAGSDRDTDRSISNTLSDVTTQGAQSEDGVEGEIPNEHSDSFTIEGFELCVSCMPPRGRAHVDDMHVGALTAAGSYRRSRAPITPAIRESRRAPAAFFELVWKKNNGWVTVEDEGALSCTHCNGGDWSHGRYKCSQCDDMSLCSRCFQNVGDTHPIHVFLRMPTKIAQQTARPPASNWLNPSQAISPLLAAPTMMAVHEGVRCSSCDVMPIRGPRYHCASCANGTDFCSRCELSGITYDAQDASAHKAHHIIIKLAFPLDGTAAATLGSTLIRAKERLHAQAIVATTHRARGHEAEDGGDVSPNDTIGGFTQAIEAPPWSESAAGSWTGEAWVRDRAAESPATAWGSPAVASARYHGVPCSSCGKEICGARFICANCPLNGYPGKEGYNLCESCEINSLAVHDPTHFFLKIRKVPPVYSTIRALDQNPYTATMGPLLPTLYKANDYQPRLSGSAVTAAVAAATRGQSPNGGPPSHYSSLSSAVSRFVRRCGEELEMQRLDAQAALVPLDALVHPSILCDRCYEVVEGPWLRCCNCVQSFDLCSRCEPAIHHDDQHVFAVFKQPVDMALFKSLVDHGDGDDGRAGAARSMLPFYLV